MCLPASNARPSSQSQKVHQHWIKWQQACCSYICCHEIFSKTGFEPTGRTLQRLCWTPCSLLTSQTGWPRIQSVRDCTHHLNQPRTIRQDTLCWPLLSLQYRNLRHLPLEANQALCASTCQWITSFLLRWHHHYWSHPERWQVRQEVDQLVHWCSQNHLELLPVKKVEMLVNFLRNPHNNLPTQECLYWGSIQIPSIPLITWSEVVLTFWLCLEDGCRIVII